MSQRICPSGNTSYMTYSMALVVVSTIWGIKMNVGAQIIIELEGLLSGHQEGFLLSRSSIKVMQVYWVLKEPEYMWMEMDIPFHPLSVKVLISKKKEEEDI